MNKLNISGQSTSVPTSVTAPVTKVPISVQPTTTPSVAPVATAPATSEVNGSQSENSQKEDGMICINQSMWEATWPSS